MLVAEFIVGKVAIEVLDGSYHLRAVPPSQWRGDRIERVADAVLANMRAADGLRLQVSLATWPNSDEISLGHSELLGGPADYGRLEDAGLISPKPLGDKLVARIRALKYGNGGRASGATTSWPEIDTWAGVDSRDLLAGVGATATGDYGDLLPSATRFRTEPAIEVPVTDPRALFAVYALTRVMPLMTGHGKSAAESPNT